MLSSRYFVRNSVLSLTTVVIVSIACASRQSLPSTTASSQISNSQAADARSVDLTVSSVANSPIGMRPWARTRRLVFRPTSLAFGSIATTSTSTKSVLVINSSRTSATISQANITGAAYTVSGLNLPLTLAAGASTSFTVIFAPTASGPANGSVSLISTLSSTNLLPLTGTGAATPVAQLTATPASTNFNNVNVGSSSTHTMAVSNTGNVNVTISQINPSGPGFSIGGIAPSTLSPGQTANYTAKFTPSSAGGVSGQISFVSTATNSPTLVSLSGTGITQLSASPGSLNFGNVLIGNTGSLPGTITATVGTVTVASATVTGSGYSLHGITLPITLTVGQSAPFTVNFAPTTTVNPPGQISFASNASNTPTLVSLSGTGATSSGQICGQRDDGLIHLPPSYSCSVLPCGSNPFPPPAKGASYVDPQYGCTVERLTDAVGDHLGTAAHHNYGTVSAMNANDTYVMINLEDGSKEIVDTSGAVIVPVANMPQDNAQQVPWDISIPTRFYFSGGAAIQRADISGLPTCASAHNCTVTTTVLHNFSGTYGSVQIPDQEDLSDDGDHLWLVGDTKAFLYTISTNTVGPAMNVGSKDSGNGWHKIQIMPSNRMLMTWSPNGAGPGAGQEVYNTDTTLNWHMFDNTIHTDCGRDLSSNEVCIVARIPDTGGGITGAGACPTWTGTQDGGIDAINMSTHKAQCVVDVNWADTEVSFRDGNAGGGWVFVTFFKSGSCPTYSCFDTPGFLNLDPAWAASWVHFAEEGILVRIDNNNGTNKYRLFHTRSRSSEYYWAIPRGSISRDGRYVIFDSNFDISNSGLPNYTDVYLTKTQ
jgi:hypothetical protein